MVGKHGRVRRDLFIAILVLMTFLPLVVYFYLQERGREQAAQRLVAHVEQTVNLTPQVKRQLAAILDQSGARSEAVTEEMERLVMADETIAYIQRADRKGNVLNSTSGAPERTHVPLLKDLPLGSPDIFAPAMARRLASAGPRSAPEFVVDIRLAPKVRGHALLGLSVEALDERLQEFQRPAHLSALQISILCVSILAVFSAYIYYLNRRTHALNAQLQQESRMAYIGTLASSLAHEVRNPLSSMKMNAQMLENRLGGLADHDDIEYFRTKITRIKGEVDRLEDSISHFLAFARPAPLRPEAVALNQVVGSILEVLEPQCQSRGVRLVRRFARGLPPVQLDPRQFAQAIENLVLNALQALGSGGTITVRTQAADGAIAVAVADDGPGIPPEVQSKIFDVFFTTRDGGTGLGLNIVSRIVEEHRGKLSVESQPGHGACFRIELPAEPDQQEGA
jgi:signal transduction histidine kinase